MKKLKKYISLILVTIITSLLISCNSPDEKDVVNIYTGLEEDGVTQYIGAFNDRYPDIKVNIIRDSTGVVSSKLMIEKDNPIADVVWGVNSSNILFLDDSNLYKEYNPSNLINFDPSYYDVKNKIPHWMGISIATVALTVNVKELEALNLPIPESYEDLLNPEYKGLIIMPNPVSSGTGYSIVSSLMQIMGEENAWNYLDKLHKNIGQYSHSGSTPTKQTATGEYCIGIGMDFLSIQMEEKNPQIKTIFPKEGSGWDIEISALVNKENIKENAKIFYEWSLSEEAMKMYADNRSRITFIDKSYTKPEFSNVKSQSINNDLTWQTDNRSRIVKIWEEKYGVDE